jgi:hypothetical protein
VRRAIMARLFADLVTPIPMPALPTKTQAAA